MAVGDERAAAGPTWAQLFSVQSLSLMLGIAAAAAAIAAVWFWSRTPDYRLLYANMADRDGGAVIAALQQMNVGYRVGEGGSILVPGEQVHDVRLRLAGQGLPRGGPVGFELLENARPGTSQFLEQINYQRALEGELARSIQTLSAVHGARVHLALARPSVFVRDQQKPSASVVLALNPGRVLDPAHVNAIVNLVASSVPDLQPQRVTVLDQSGLLLSGQRDGLTAQGLDPSQLKYVQEVEAAVVRRIETILTPIVGHGNVRAQVTADVDFSVVERAEEEFKPNQAAASAAVRSQQTSETVSPSGTQAGGVPGALSNQPPAPAAAPIVGTAPAPAAAKGAGAPAAPIAPAANSHKDATFNYEVDRTIRHIRQPVGSLRRLSAAVVVNQRKTVAADGKASYRPLSDEEIKQIVQLAREAMGFNEPRGDSLNVANRAFSEPEPVEVPDVPFWKDPAIIDGAKGAGRTLLFAALALYLFFAFIRPTFRRLTTPPALPPPALEAPAVGLPGLGPRSYAGNLEAARQVAQQEPRLVANVVKTWVGGANE